MSSIFDRVPNSNCINPAKPGVYEGSGLDSVADVIKAYQRGFHGCFVMHENLPMWARAIAKYCRDQFMAEAPKPLFSAAVTEPLLDGKGKRVIPWNLALKFLPSWYQLAQQTGDCVACSLNWNGFTTQLAIQILLMNRPLEFIAPYGVALTYGCRGWTGQGMALSDAAHTAATKGTQLRKPYVNGKYDFTDAGRDESYGIQWGGSGPPSDLVNETKAQIEHTVSAFDGDIQAVKDVLFNGGTIQTGGTITGTQTGNPICRLTGVGGHAQQIIGYDDTDECRKWLKDKAGISLAETECVVFHTQSWGPYYSLSNWPTELWGTNPKNIWPTTGKDAMTVIRQEAYAYGPDVDGFAPHDIDWTKMGV